MNEEPAGIIGIVGGTGFDRFDGLGELEPKSIDTPYGAPSGPLQLGQLRGVPVCFLARHGESHGIPPHRINYRANLWAIRSVGVRWVLAVAAVGGIDKRMASGAIVIPDQIIDYTWGREATFHEPPESDVRHIDFSYPYAADARQALLRGAERAKLHRFDGAVYGATQGPRLESAAEIDRMERDGCHIVGMTGMPEAALAREAGLRYATCALVVNPAAGRGPGEITMAEIGGVLERGMARVRCLLGEAVQLLGTQ